jgi:hypothetical protein
MLESADLYDIVEIGKVYQLGEYEVLVVSTTGIAYYPDGKLYRAEQKIAMIDHVGDRYVITLTYLVEDSSKYDGVLDSVVRSFKILQ